MKSNRKITLLLSLAAVCFTAHSLGAATTDVNGSFTLSSQTHWGSAVLPPGHYTFTLDRTAGHGMITVRQETKAVGMILVPGSTLTNTSGGSSMLIVRNRVRSLHLAPLGLTYTYPSHEQEKIGIARGSGVVTAVVPIAEK